MHAPSILIEKREAEVMLPVFTFTVTGPPRTKKNSPIPTPARTKDGRAFVRILPSKAYRQWLKAALQQSPAIRARLARAGARLPIRGSVAIRALVYRESRTGDLLGYLDALADALQEPLCNAHGKTTREGMGIIADDRLVVSWDGSRLLKDSACPRVEVQIEVVGEGPGMLEFGGEEEF